MQEDMHYYGTYAMARAAGIEAKHAKVIAHAAQYVDDATANDSEVHKDGGMFATIATAHTNSEAIANAAADHTEQRKVWVPFHFFPGNQGDDLTQKLTCVKNSPLAQEMVQHHIEHAAAVKDEYGLTLMGIMAHVYADTFAHYGFCGVSSSSNKVDAKSFQLHVNDPKTKAYIMNKFSGFLTKYTPSFIVKRYRKLASKGASAVTGALGHGAVGTYPDRPFLNWSFKFKYHDKDKSKEIYEQRDNQKTFLEACEELYKAFSQFAQKAGIEKNPKSFDSIKETVKNILALEKAKEGRIEAWLDAINDNLLFDKEENEFVHYSMHEWEQQIQDFEELPSSKDILKEDVYKFFQSATYHRDYTLKFLLPKHGIAVI